MNNVTYEQKFPGTKDKSSFLLNFIHPPQLILCDLSIQRPFKTFMIRDQSENKTETCNKKKPAGMDKGGYKKTFLMEVNTELISIGHFIQ